MSRVSLVRSRVGLGDPGCVSDGPGWVWAGRVMSSNKRAHGSEEKLESAAKAPKTERVVVVVDDDDTDQSDGEEAPAEKKEKPEPKAEADAEDAEDAEEPESEEEEEEEEEPLIKWWEKNCGRKLDFDADQAVVTIAWAWVNSGDQSETPPRYFVIPMRELSFYELEAMRAWAEMDHVPDDVNCDGPAEPRRLARHTDAEFAELMKEYEENLQHWKSYMLFRRVALRSAMVGFKDLADIKPDLCIQVIEVIDTM